VTGAPAGQPIVAHVNWTGSRLVVARVMEQLSLTMRPKYSTITQVLWIEDGRLEIVTDTGHSDEPLRFTREKQ
jgi:hypothetical protein